MNATLTGRIFAVLLAAVLAAACAKPVIVERDAAFYKTLGDQYQAEGRYKKAIQAYEDALLRAESPEFAAEMQLSLADSYFFYNDYDEAIPVYQTYLDVYADSPKADTAYLRLGLSYYNIMNRPIRDQTDTELAFEYLNKVKTRAPALAAEYELDEKIREIRERLARKELLVGKYYSRIREREPAMLRYKYLVDNYEDCEAYPEGVYLLVRELVKTDPAKAETYLTLLKMKYPESKYVDKTRNIIDKYAAK